jgi:CRISPR/Cas system CSM-associated protein Csm3 (group 7 of RAMP superfamily)
MADILKSNKVIKASVSLFLKTPLLLKSGYDDIFSDSTIEKTYDGENIHINGYVWASLLRRCLDRIDEDFYKKIGKYEPRKDRQEGVSPLWCESSFVPIKDELYIRPGNAIDRKYGAGKAGALFNDEIVAAGLGLKLNFNYFLSQNEKEDIVEKLFLGGLWVLNAGIENIGGGWSYGMGRLGVRDVRIKRLDLGNDRERKYLWRFDEEALSGAKKLSLENVERPDIKKPWVTIHVEASILDGQMLSINSSYPAFNTSKSYAEYPDSFVYQGYRIDEKGELKAEYIIPGRTIRQALLSVPLERKLRTIGRDVICDSLGSFCNCYKCREHRKKNKSGDSSQCECLKCHWFGSGGKGGIVAVTDAYVKDGETKVIHRIQLCEHSMQNVNLFSSEYLTKGRFAFDVIIDKNEREEFGTRLEDELKWLFGQMKIDANAPPGWYRIGATSTATGQIMILKEPEIRDCGVIDGE